MKNFFTKLLIVCVLFAAIGGTTSCVQDPNADGSGPALIELTGEPIVTNAVSVDIPLKAENLSKLAFMVEEYVIDEEGKEWAIRGYDANKKPITYREVSKNPNINLIFNAQKNKKGKVIENVKSLDNLHISGNEGLDKSKHFVVYIAGVDNSKSKKFYNNGEIFSVKFDTPEKYSDDDVAVIRENYEGMDVAITFPAAVRNRGNCIRWGVTNIATKAYHDFTNGYVRSSAEALYLCDFVYPASIIHSDTVLNINHYNAYRRNANGEVGYYTVGVHDVEEVDPNDTTITSEVSPIQYYYLFTPGEPLVLMLGEASYCSKENGLEPNMGWSYGYEVGWYWFPFSLEDLVKAQMKDPNVNPELFWYSVENGYEYDAWHKTITLTLPGPDKFDGNVNVSVSDLSTKSGKITFSPDDKTYMYVWGIYEETDAYESGFNDITKRFLNNDESLWQWFTTAEMAGSFGINYNYAAEGTKTIELSNYFAQLTAGGTYHIVVNAMGAVMENGDYQTDVLKQNFQHISFVLEDYTLPEPELVITPYEAYSPWKVKFNVKNPNYKTNPVEKVSFAANYTREYEIYMNQYEYTYSDIVLANAGFSLYQLSSTDIVLVNSPYGADIEFDVLENSAFTAAFMAWNSEGRPSNPDKEGNDGKPMGVAEAFSDKIAPQDRVPGMDQLEALSGDWTATANVMVYDSSTGNHNETVLNWKVTIGALPSDYVFTEAEYELYEKNGVDRVSADAYLAEFNQQSATYNATVAGQNRVLCQGWQLDGENALKTASPWDLFLMEGYNSSEVVNLFHDFGPKWFLQVDAEGDIFIPVNTNRIAPLTMWSDGVARYLLPGNYKTTYYFPYDTDEGMQDSVKSVGFPVEISDDGNSITIYAYQIKTSEDAEPILFSPSVLYDYNGNLNFYNNYVVGNVVLTKGWNGGAQPEPEIARASANLNKNTKQQSGVAINGATYTIASKPYSPTALVPRKKAAEPTVSTVKAITPEERESKMAKLLKRIGLFGTARK